MLESLCNPFEDWEPVDEIYGFPSSNQLLQDSSSNDYQGDIFSWGPVQLEESLHRG